SPHAAFLPRHARSSPSVPQLRMAPDQRHRRVFFVHAGGLQYAAVSRAADGGDDAAAGTGEYAQSNWGVDLSGWQSIVSRAVDQSVRQVVSSAWRAIPSTFWARPFCSLRI